MIKNYVKIALRNLNRNRSHSVINILGLSIGIACCILILLWVADEKSYDKWNDKADRIYRVTPEANFGGSHRHFAVSPAPLAQALVNDFPEVESAVRFRNYGSSLVKRDFQNYKESRIIYTDSTLFSVFDLEVIAGNPQRALSNPNSIVINESTAKKYFPGEDAVGKTLTFDNSQKMNVQGVIKDMPLNSHFNFDFFVSLTGGREANNGMWISHNFVTYYVLKKGIDHTLFEAKVFPHLLEKYISPQIEVMMGRSYDELVNSGAFLKYHFQALKDIHLKSDLDIELAANGSILYVWIFLAAAIFILLIACVNFMNLTTARSILRAKEIGIRKVMGSMRKNLIYQFLSESILLSIIAMFIGLAIAQIGLPYYNELADKQLIIPFDSIAFWGYVFVGTLLVGFLSGSYPAFFLSGFKPIQALAGKWHEQKGKSYLRNSLVIFQFFIATILIIGTIVIHLQMQFIQNKKLGFDRDQVLIIQDTDALGSNTHSFKNELLSNPSIKSATYSNFLPVPSSRNDSPLCKTAEFRPDNCVSIQIWDVDNDYISTLGMDILDGRDFSADMPSDSQAVIINERAAQLFGFDDPIGESIYSALTQSSAADNSPTPLKIIGVVKNFHYESLRNNVQALSLVLAPSSGTLGLKIANAKPAQIIGFIENTWKNMAPGQPFNYQFMDESFDRIYRSEIRISRIFNLFSGLSIFIACLGLFGLASFATERRSREIGIRKVLGATTLEIVSLLSKDFIKLVLLALLVSGPIAWYFMNQWLNNFAYGINLSWEIFAIAGFLVIGIAFATVSFQSIKAAHTNPVNSIRTE